jgi:hypothetical protein
MKTAADVSADVSADNLEAGPRYIRGVPHPLPDGEHIVWEGAPSVGAVARHVFHWRLVAAYFMAMLALWGLTTDVVRGTEEYAAAASLRAAAVVFVLACVFGLSRAVATTTWYAITTHRVVLRIGMAFPMSLNIPFAVLESAAVGRFRDGTGQLALNITAEHRLAYIALWPHCRVWRINRPAPLLRGLEAPEAVARILTAAVTEAAERERLVAETEVSTRIERPGTARPVPRATRVASVGA